MSKKILAPYEDVTYRVLGICMAAHRRIGPGQKEDVYQLVNFGGRSLQWRRVLPSPPATEFRHDYRWMFAPDWLKAQNQQGSPDATR